VPRMALQKSMPKKKRQTKARQTGSEKVERLAHGLPNKQETPALPSSSCPRNSKAPPRPFQPHPSTITAVPSWNVVEETQRRMPRSAHFAKKRGRRQGTEKGRLLRASRTQVQVRTGSTEPLNSANLEKTRHKILSSREPATSSDLPPLQTSPPDR
jgi:hypothetical protein